MPILANLPFPWTRRGATFGEPGDTVIPAPPIQSPPPPETPNIPPIGPPQPVPQEGPPRPAPYPGSPAQPQRPLQPGPYQPTDPGGVPPGFRPGQMPPGPFPDVPAVPEIPPGWIGHPVPPTDPGMPGEPPWMQGGHIGEVNCEAWAPIINPATGEPVPGGYVCLGHDGLGNPILQIVDGNGNVIGLGPSNFRPKPYEPWKGPRSTSGGPADALPAASGAAAGGDACAAIGAVIEFGAGLVLGAVIAELQSLAIQAVVIGGPAAICNHQKEQLSSTLGKTGRAVATMRNNAQAAANAIRNDLRDPNLSAECRAALRAALSQLNLLIFQADNLASMIARASAETSSIDCNQNPAIGPGPHGGGSPGLAQAAVDDVKQAMAELQQQANAAEAAVAEASRACACKPKQGRPNCPPGSVAVTIASPDGLRRGWICKKQAFGFGPGGPILIAP